MAATDVRSRDMENRAGPPYRLTRDRTRLGDALVAPDAVVLGGFWSSAPKKAQKIPVRTAHWFSCSAYARPLVSARRRSAAAGFGAGAESHLGTDQGPSGRKVIQ